jgi:hypothetical protein
MGTFLVNVAICGGSALNQRYNCNKENKQLDVYESVHNSINHTEITNNMQTCNRIYYSYVYQFLNMFLTTHRTSSGAQNL